MLPMYEENLSSINAASTATDHIRLLRPSRIKRKLWKLKVFSLQKAPPFAALSYSWGDRRGDVFINIDTGSTTAGLLISTDLHRAMIRLSKANRQRQKTDALGEATRKLRWLWIDAICIDQTSNSEKSHQVTMMRTIYKAADRVYVWLGEGTSWIDRGPDILQTRSLWKATLRAGINLDKIKEWILQGMHVWWNRLWVRLLNITLNKALTKRDPTKSRSSRK